MDFDVTITLAHVGGDPALGEAVLTSFAEAAPGSGPVVDQNVATGEATVSFSVAATDAPAAAQSVIAILRAATTSLEADAARSTAIHVEAAVDRELQPA